MPALVAPDALSAWRGPALLVVDTHGECGNRPPIAGFYYREARFLCRFNVRVNGEVPWLCETAAPRPDTLAFNYVHPEIMQPGGGGTGQSGDEENTDAAGIPERSLDLLLTYRVHLDRLEVVLDIANRARMPVACELRCELSADFADIQEANSGKREQDASVSIEPEEGCIRFVYCHPQLTYHTDVRHAPQWQWDGSALRANLRLGAQTKERHVFDVIASDADAPLTTSDVEERELALAEWQQAFASIHAAGNRVFEEVVRRNVRDFASFAMATGPRDEWLSLQAGIPMYPAFFGRDALTAGWQAASVDSGRALDAALIRLGRLQSNREYAWRDEQPGRIPYQVRTGPLARLDLNPYSAYYADYASPLMYVIALANLFAWNGDLERVRRHWDVARRIMDWARQRGDIDGDGYLEYHTQSTQGTKNQGWKDSGDAIVYDDGSPVPPPIATCELQGYWYLAQELMSLLSGVLNAPADAAAFREDGADLKRRFNRDWWAPDERFFALALDPKKRQVRAVTSNVGHCLACGIIDGDHLRHVVGRMFEDDVFSGWGIRTLSSSHAYYNPVSYHRGTVWAVEQATILFGLRRFGFNARALDLAAALFELAQLYPDYRIPECIGGYARAERDTPGAYPRANPVQLWNATAFPLIVQSLLGLLPLASIETLAIDPVLPTWLPSLELRNLRVGAARVSLRFARDRNGRTDWDVIHKSGTLHIVRQPPPESVSAGPLDRLQGLLETAL
jgi:glycogen debranching enzyme